MATNKVNFCITTQNNVTDFLTSLNMQRALYKQYVALDLGNLITQADIDTAGISCTVQQLKDAIASLEAVETFLDTGHYTNLYRLKP